MSLQNDLEGVIRGQEERLYRAMSSSNVEELDALIADDLIFVGPDGNLATKQQDLALHQSRAVVFTRFEPKALQVKAHDGFALAFATVYLEGTALGQPFAGEFQYTRTWANRDGRWQVVAGSVTPIRPPA